ncbi:hypothetical protein Bhyg_08493 [Pseudolycoriella hygida]|uniref:Uncharacterized protein n=1 Tax=Pseudolycoriella hygida TaxID=35572 RepID=A0A9Q0N4W2_9DIPT|nr:hypothetical protein Bhyg_08493 [Pseudolycoriella hygida]
MACSNNTPIHSPDRQSIIGIKRRSRASDTLLATAAAMLKVLGISSSTRRNRNKGSKSKKSAKPSLSVIAYICRNW